MRQLRDISLNWFQFGTDGYSPHLRRKLIITNVLVTLTSVGAFNFMIAFLLHDPYGLRYPIAALALAIPLFMTTPLLHRFGPHAGSLYNLTVWYVFGPTLAYLLGAETGIYFLFLVGMTSAILIFGMRHNLISIVNICIQFYLFLYAAKAWTTPAPMVEMSESFKESIFVAMTLFAVLFIFFMVYYAFSQMHRAEEALEQEFNRSEHLLSLLMPALIAEKLKNAPDDIIAQAHEETTVLFADVAGFTERFADRRPEEIVKFLTLLFARFDALATKHGVEKIKTLGDSFMAAGGMPLAQEDHLERVANMALDMMEVARSVSLELNESVQLRIGFDTGPVVAGVLGAKKPFYDVWGDTVNLAARLEQSGEEGRIQVSESTKDLLGDAFTFERRGTVELKGKGKVKVWFLTGRAAMERVDAAE